MLHSVPDAGAPLPRILLALSVKLSRAPANVSFTNDLLPIAAPRGQPLQQESIGNPSLRNRRNLQQDMETCPP